MATINEAYEVLSNEGRYHADLADLTLPSLSFSLLTLTVQNFVHDLTMATTRTTQHLGKALTHIRSRKEGTHSKILSSSKADLSSPSTITECYTHVITSIALLQSLYGLLFMLGFPGLGRQRWVGPWFRASPV